MSTNVCDPAFQIPTYSTSGSGSGTSFFKNIDAVSVESDLISCGALTVNGVPITTTTTDKVQNMQPYPI